MILPRLKSIIFNTESPWSCSAIAPSLIVGSCRVTVTVTYTPYKNHANPTACYNFLHVFEWGVSYSSCNLAIALILRILNYPSRDFFDIFGQTLSHFMKLPFCLLTFCPNYIGWKTLTYFNIINLIAMWRSLSYKFLVRPAALTN